jgi:hypothetical protein
MAATELRVEKLTVPKSSTEVAGLLQRLLSIKGLVSFSVSREGVEIKRYRSLHDPPISDESPIEEPELGIALATLEEIIEIEDCPTTELSLTRAAHLISSRGFAPSILVLPSEEYVKVFQDITGPITPDFSEGAGSVFISGYRVEISDMLADNTFLMLGSLVSTYHLDSVRMAVRIFVKGVNNGVDQERDSVIGEDAATA